MRIKDFSFYVLILSHICKRQFKIGFDVYISENIISLLSSFRLGNTLYVLTLPVSHWDNVEVDSLMTSMSKAKVWLGFLFHIKEVSQPFFNVWFFINLCSFGLAFLQLHGHFILKSKTIINRRCEHFVRTSFVFRSNGIEMGIVPLRWSLNVQ